MTESNVRAPVLLVVVSETNASHLTEELQESGYQPFFCNTKRNCAKARQLMRRKNVEVRTVGAIISLRLAGLVDFAELSGINPQPFVKQSYR